MGRAIKLPFAETPRCWNEKRDLFSGSLEIDEEKTEAAAATAVLMKPTAAPREGPPPPEPKIFRADRPFIYLLVEQKTGAILFMGRFVKPK